MVLLTPVFCDKCHNLPLWAVRKALELTEATAQFRLALGAKARTGNHRNPLPCSLLRFQMQKLRKTTSERDLAQRNKFCRIAKCNSHCPDFFPVSVDTSAPSALERWHPQQWLWSSSIWSVAKVGSNYLSCISWLMLEVDSFPLTLKHDDILAVVWPCLSLMALPVLKRKCCQRNLQLTIYLLVSA